MQRELTQTREELQKGVLEMPAEAREASAAMRRAITEQIEAINELSKIVARYAGESMPPPQPPSPRRCRRQAARRPVRRGREPSRAARQPRAARPSRASGERRTRRPSRSAGRRAAAPAATAPPKPQRLPPAQPLETAPRGGNGEARGWVADLLRRASSSEDGRAQPAASAADGEPAPPASARRRRWWNSLNSLSIDIARAIDHEASVELWDRYKRGERNVFTRRLYTLQGQKTFDELRRKYERDGDFRQAVDNYIGDFERLLSQVSKDDSDPRWRACI